MTTIRQSNLWASHSTRSNSLKSGRRVPSEALAFAIASGPPIFDMAKKGCSAKTFLMYRRSDSYPSDSELNGQAF